MLLGSITSSNNPARPFPTEPYRAPPSPTEPYPVRYWRRMMSRGSDISAVQRDRISRAIRRARTASGLDQTAFGRELGKLRGTGPLHRTTIGNWETGRTDPLALDLLCAAELGQVSPGGLLEPYQMRLDIDQINLRLEEAEDARAELRGEIARLRRELLELRRAAFGHEATRSPSEATGSGGSS